MQVGEAGVVVAAETGVQVGEAGVQVAAETGVQVGEAAEQILIASLMCPVILVVQGPGHSAAKCPVGVIPTSKNGVEKSVEKASVNKIRGCLYHFEHCQLSLLYLVELQKLFHCWLDLCFFSFWLENRFQSKVISPKQQQMLSW